MSTSSGFGKFLRFMFCATAALFLAGMFLMTCSKGFGPCGPVDGFGAVGYLFALLSILGLIGTTLLSMVWGAIELLFSTKDLPRNTRNDFE